MQTTPNVLLTLPIHSAAEKLLSQFARIIYAPDTQPETLIVSARNADAVIVRAQLPDSFFYASPKIKVAVRHGSGVDMIPLDQATEHNVVVANVPGVNARSVAEYVIWALLSGRRRFMQVINPQRLDQPLPWQWARKFADDGHEIDGSRIGIVGFGNVGKSLATMLKAVWNVEILVYNRTAITSQVGVRQTSLDDLLTQCDAVVLALPLTELTRHLLDAQRLALMKLGSVLINVARGPIIEEAALLPALQMHRPGLAVLDVFHQQPLSAEDPLWTHPQVLLTTHIAGITDESMRKMGEGAVIAVRDTLNGVRPQHFVNPAVWDSRRT